MKKTILAVIFFIFIINCGCSATAEPKEDTSMRSYFEEDVMPAGPVISLTLEEKADNTKDLLSSVQDSYGIMTELSQKEDAPKKGVKAAKKVQKKYEARLKELAEADFSDFSVSELDDISEELSNIISAIREARDLLNK